jgi:hypothetical protein
MRPLRKIAVKVSATCFKLRQNLNRSEEGFENIRKRNYLDADNANYDYDT